jgi:hypothetical protein
MKVQLTDVRGKKVVYEMEVEPDVAKLLVRRDQTVAFQGVQYGFLSANKERNRYSPMLPPATLEELWLVGPDAATGNG